MWIEVPIVCNNPELAHLKDLNIPFDGHQYDVRIGKINVRLITGYYPDSTHKETIVCASGDEFSVALNYFEFDKLINK